MTYQQEEHFLTEKRKRFDDIQELPENRPALLLEQFILEMSKKSISSFMI